MVSQILILTLIIFILLIATLGLLAFFINKNHIEQSISEVEKMLIKLDYYIEKVYYVDRFLLMTANKSMTKLIFISNYNSIKKNEIKIKEIKAESILQIVKNNFVCKILYLDKGKTEELELKTIQCGELIDLIHEIYKETKIKKIKNHYKDINFTTITVSDWSCDYVFAYNANKSNLAYLCTSQNDKSGFVELLNSTMILDVKYNYFQVPIFGIPQQLSSVDEEFFNKVYRSLLENIKTFATEIAENNIYYNYDKGMIYLTNSKDSIEAIKLKDIDDVIYQDNKISFVLAYSNKTMNFLCNYNFVEAFKKFILDYNLNKLSSNFNYQTDKLINATDNTKFIIDYTKKRYIYCANLYSPTKFSFFNIFFSSVKSVKDIQSGLAHFVRIEYGENETMDISCNKKEVATYIAAQIRAASKVYDKKDY